MHDFSINRLRHQQNSTRHNAWYVSQVFLDFAQILFAVNHEFELIIVPRYELPNNFRLPTHSEMFLYDRLLGINRHRIVQLGTDRHQIANDRPKDDTGCFNRYLAIQFFEQLGEFDDFRRVHRLAARQNDMRSVKKHYSACNFIERQVGTRCLFFAVESGVCRIAKPAMQRATEEPNKHAGLARPNPFALPRLENL